MRAAADGATALLLTCSALRARRGRTCSIDRFRRHHVVLEPVTEEANAGPASGIIEVVVARGYTV
jgi:hypothetical protein